jgi:hypothetical protein
MGRFVKNTVFDSGSYALGLAATSASFRPNVAGITGQTALRYSTSSDKLEYYSQGGNVWQTVANVGSGIANIVESSFTGNSSISTYSPFDSGLTYTSGQAKELLVFNGGVPQIPITNYTISGNSITFLGSVNNGATILIFHNFASTIPV